MNNLEDEGPKPMRNMRPAEKQPTSAEKFQNEHEAKYEARVRPSLDRVGQVHAHNKACPNMYDELEKKRSLANPNAFASANQTATISNQRQNSFSSAKQMAEAKKEHICCNCLLKIKRNKKRTGTKKRYYRARYSRRAIIKPKCRCNSARNRQYCKVRYSTSYQSNFFQESDEDVDMANNDYRKGLTISSSRDSRKSNIEHKQSRIIKKQNSNASQNPVTHTCPIS